MVRKHGASGYRAGCRCPVCTEGQRKRKEAYRARKTGEAAVTVLPSQQEPAAPPAEAVGQLERLTRELVNARAIRGEEGDLVAAQAVAAARVIDQALAEGRPHLMSPAHRVLNDCLDRLQRLGPQRPIPPGMDPDEFDVDAFVDGLTKLGDPSLMHADWPVSGRPE